MNKKESMEQLKGVVKPTKTTYRRSFRSILKDKSKDDPQILEDVTFEDDDYDDDYLFDYCIEEAQDDDFQLDFAEIEIEDKDENQEVDRFFLEEQSDESFAEYDYLDQKPLEEELSFFQEIENFPEMDAPSKDSIEVEDVVETKYVHIRPSVLDVGEFVDPLTGLLLPKPAKTQASVDDKKDSGAVVQDEDKDRQAGSEDEEEVDFSELFELDRRATKMERKISYMPEYELAESDFLNVMITFDSSVKRSLPSMTTATEEAKRIEEQRYIDNAIHQFLNEILNRIVTVSEEYAIETEIRNKLDKRRLLRDISMRKRQFEADLIQANFMERKAVEYFRKKKLFRNLMDRTNSDWPSEITYYKGVLARLDSNLSAQEETRRMAREEIIMLENELEFRSADVLDKLRFLEDTMRKIITRDDREELKLAVNRSIALFEHERAQLNILRGKLIVKQDTLATLINKLNKISELGNDVNFADYNNMHIKTLDLSSKVDDRDNDLMKMRWRYTSSLHVYAHVKERSTMQKRTLNNEVERLTLLIDEKIMVKEQLYKLKLERINTSKKMDDLRYQSGILHNMGLMREYDSTNDIIKEKTKRNQALRKQLNDLKLKFRQMEAEIEHEQQQQQQELRKRQKNKYLKSFKNSLANRSSIH